MKFENTEVFNFEGAFRGLRNPMNSWAKSDSKWSTDGKSYLIGDQDMNLAQRLIRAGSEHRKFMRQIFVSVDITAPLFWWKEADQYKIGATTNSCSTMHKLASTPITLDCFETDDYCPDLQMFIQNHDENPYYYTATVGKEFLHLLSIMETLRLEYVKTKDKRYWKELIRMLPESWLQTRTVTLTYENIYAMVHQRKNHKLVEWSEYFINWAKSLPYANQLLFWDEGENGNA